MAYVSKDKKLRPSILDRLIDQDPETSMDVEKSRFVQLTELRNSVRRDLESLLNTRCRVVSPLETLEETQDTIMNYGLPDLATVNMLNLDQQQDFAKKVEDILKTYEPRFKSVNVQYVTSHDQSDRTMRFRIDAVIWADPAPEIVVFDSVLEPILRTVKVEDSGHG